MKRITVALLLCLACSGTDVQQEASVDADTATVAEAAQPPEPPIDPARATALPSVCENLPWEILDTAVERDSLRARFGEPSSVAAETQPNRHVEGVIDTIFDIRYPGLVVGIHRPGGGGDLATRVEVEDNRYLRYPRIGIGVPADSVEAHLGDATDGEPDRLTYSCGEAVDQPVTFELRDGRVTRIVVEYYVD